MTVKSSSSNLDGENETANLADGEDLKTAYCRQGARHCYISLEGNGLVSDSKEKNSVHLFLNPVFGKSYL